MEPPFKAQLSVKTDIEDGDRLIESEIEIEYYE